MIIETTAANTGGSRLGLKKDDRVTVNDLLFGLLMKSGNDAAVALAIHTAGSINNFAELMNKKANELDLEKTHFVTPHGLDDPNHYTTAIELAKLTDYALNNSIFSTIVKTKYAVISINGEQIQLKNTNEILCSDYEGVYGVKTGFTNNAGRCLVTSIKKENIDIIIVVLGADTRNDRAKDTIKLVNYIYNNYKIKNVKELVEEEYYNWKNINQERIYVYKADSKLETKIGNIEIDEIVTDKNIEIEINSINYMEAPIEKNKKIGIITVKNGNEILEQIDIMTDREVDRMNIADYLIIFAKAFCL